MARYFSMFSGNRFWETKYKRNTPSFTPYCIPHRKKLKELGLLRFEGKWWVKLQLRRWRGRDNKVKELYLKFHKNEAVYTRPRQP